MEMPPRPSARNEVVKKRLAEIPGNVVQSLAGERDRNTERYGHEGAKMGAVAGHLAEIIGGKVIGQGAERVVIEQKDGKVLGIYRYPEREGALRQKERFYTFKILHTLFPQFFPEVYAAGISSNIPDSLSVIAPMIQKLFPEQVLSYTITEKIESATKNFYTETRSKEDGSKETIRISHDDGRVLKDGEGEIPPRRGPDKEGVALAGNYEDAVQTLDSLGIHLLTDDEPGKNNIGKVYTDGTAYLSKVTKENTADMSLKGKDVYFQPSLNSEGGGELTEREMSSLIDWMKKEKYSDLAIDNVESSFGRLLVLQKEQMKS